MELKEMILSTLAEIGEEEMSAPSDLNETPAPSRAPEQAPKPHEADEDELLFLERLRERLLVLFEGFLSPNLKSPEAKIDLTLNFLEYLLAMLDERIETLKKP